MIWNEFLVDRRLTFEGVAVGAGCMFGVDSARVAVAEDVFEADRSAGVRCVVMYENGEFLTRIGVYTTDDRLAGAEPLQAVGKFAERLRCACLISDDSVNPYSWILVSGVGQHRQVFLDAEELDEYERYVLRR